MLVIRVIILIRVPRWFVLLIVLFYVLLIVMLDVLLIVLFYVYIDIHSTIRPLAVFERVTLYPFAYSCFANAQPFCCFIYGQPRHFSSVLPSYLGSQNLMLA